MKKAYMTSVIAIFLLFNACTISQTYGPYQGKVVDKDTGLAIEGAVVLMSFFVDGPMGATSFVDATEVLTDEQGEFLVSKMNFTKVRPMHEWLPPKVLIFKPGYGAFPRHKEVVIDEGGYVEERSMIIKLPKLKSREEEMENMSNLFVLPQVPTKRQKMLVKYINTESKRLGLMYQ